MKKFGKSWVVVTCFLVLWGYQKCEAQQDNNYKRFGKWLVQDPISFVKDFSKERAIGLGLTGVTAYSLTFIDKQNSIALQNSLSGSNFLQGVNDITHPNYVGAFAATLFGSSLLTKNTKFQDAAFTSLQAVLYNHITVGALKFAFSRARPYEQEGVRDFDILEDSHTSFPSGHTSTAFALVTPWVMYYDHPASYGLYALPAAVGIGRIADGAHWLSDVTTAAVIGTYWGYYLSKKHMDIKNDNDNIDISPVTLGKGGGIHLNISF